MTELAIPELSLVVLVGVTGSGKSTFARTHFKPTEVISSDFCRGLVTDDETDQSATKDAAEVRGDHLGRLEVHTGERRLARSGHADQDDQAQLGDGQLGHGSACLTKTASWVGGPASGCSGPTGRKRTW